MNGDGKRMRVGGKFAGQLFLSFQSMQGTHMLWMQEGMQRALQVQKGNALFFVTVQDHVQTNFHLLLTILMKMI